MRFGPPLALAATAGAIGALVLTAGSGAQTGREASERAPQDRTAPRQVGWHRVLAGESLSSIAVRTGVSLAQLKDLNPQIPGSDLTAGQRIRIPR